MLPLITGTESITTGNCISLEGAANRGYCPCRHNEGSRAMLRLLFVVCFFLCSVVAMQGQTFAESVTGGDPTGQCNKQTSIKKRISCARSWSNSVATGYEEAIAKNSFGTMRFYSYSEVTCSVDKCTTQDGAGGQDQINDVLSILGLENEPIAFLKVEIVCLECPKYLAPSSYFLQLANNYGYNDSCYVEFQTSPRCTLKMPIIYDQNGQPVPAGITRLLSIWGSTSVKNGPAGAKVSTTVDVGYYSGSGAMVEASVVNAKGKVFKGVTVVGTSGHIYN